MALCSISKYLVRERISTPLKYFVTFSKPKIIFREINQFMMSGWGWDWDWGDFELRDFEIGGLMSCGILRTEGYWAGGFCDQRAIDWRDFENGGILSGGILRSVGYWAVGFWDRRAIERGILSRRDNLRRDFEIEPRVGGFEFKNQKNIINFFHFS